MWYVREFCFQVWQIGFVGVCYMDIEIFFYIVVSYVVGLCYEVVDYVVKVDVVILI